MRVIAPLFNTVRKIEIKQRHGAKSGCVFSQDHLGKRGKLGGAYKFARQKIAPWKLKLNLVNLAFPK